MNDVDNVLQATSIRPNNRGIYIWTVAVATLTAVTFTNRISVLTLAALHMYWSARGEMVNRTENVDFQCMQRHSAVRIPRGPGRPALANLLIVAATYCRPLRS